MAWRPGIGIRARNSGPSAAGRNRQEPPAQEQAQVRAPSSVARISLIHGDVSTQRGDSGDWATAALNQPMVSSDKVSTGANSRAEVQLDHANILRLGDNTLASIANLTRNQIQVQLDHGLIDYSVFKGTEAEVEIDTANVGDSSRHRTTEFTASKSTPRRDPGNRPQGVG